MNTVQKVVEKFVKISFESLSDYFRWWRMKRKAFARNATPTCRK